VILVHGQSGTSVQWLVVKAIVLDIDNIRIQKTHINLIVVNGQWHNVKDVMCFHHARKLSFLKNCYTVYNKKLKWLVKLTIKTIKNKIEKISFDDNMTIKVLLKNQIFVNYLGPYYNSLLFVVIKRAYFNCVNVKKIYNNIDFWASLRTTNDLYVKTGFLLNITFA